MREEEINLAIGARRLRWLTMVLSCAIIFAAFREPLRAQVSTTTVQGTVYRADGTAAQGTVIVSWPAFATATNQAVAAGTITANIGEDGFLTLNLAPS